MINETENINELLITYLTGNASKEEKELIEDWLDKSELNKKYFAEVSDVWEVSGITKSVESDTGVHLKKLNNRIKKQNQSKTLTLNFIKYAAIFVIALGLGSLIPFFLDFDYTSSKIISENTIHAPNGSKTNLVLPDGSEVWLNSGSSITYQDGFLTKKNREIKLIGEAYFKVSKNKKRPFIVKTNEVAIQALGTSFNVKAYPEEPTIKATLVEGSISVHKLKEEDREIILTPNQQAIVNKGSNAAISILKNINVNKYTSWKDKNWIIDNEELGTLAKKLERKYDVTIVFKDKKYQELRFSGTLTDVSLEQILEVISFASPFSYKIDGKTVILDTK